MNRGALPSGGSITHPTRVWAVHRDFLPKRTVWEGKQKKNFSLEKLKNTDSPR